MSRYAVIYADPAWGYQSSGNPATKRPCLKRGDKPQSVNHYYKTIIPSEIMRLPVGDICEKNSVLFLWTPTPLLPEALETMKAWGFKYKTMITWHKERCKGMGYWFRGHTEHILFGVRGKVKAFRSLEQNIKLLPVQKHSEKPDQFREMIESVTSNMGNKIELFARKKHEGWDSLGFDIDGLDIAESLRSLIK